VTDDDLESVAAPNCPRDLLPMVPEGSTYKHVGTVLRRVVKV
jgi:hypothetical protein